MPIKCGLVQMRREKFSCQRLENDTPTICISKWAFHLTSANFTINLQKIKKKKIIISLNHNFHLIHNAQLSRIIRCMACVWRGVHRLHGNFDWVILFSTNAHQQQRRQRWERNKLNLALENRRRNWCWQQVPCMPHAFAFCSHCDCTITGDTVGGISISIGRWCFSVSRHESVAMFQFSTKAETTCKQKREPKQPFIRISHSVWEDNLVAHTHATH